jgi:hypothetical protein
MMTIQAYGLTHLPLLSLLLGVMPEAVRRREARRFEPISGNLECAMWLTNQSWPKVLAGLKTRGFKLWVERGETAIWCYGVGRVKTGEAPMILALLWETIETGQKARVLFHHEQGPPKLMVISKNDL